MKALALLLVCTTAYAQDAEPEIQRFAPWPTARLVLDLELVTQARYVARSGDDLSELRLDRGELGARVALVRDAAAELRLEAIRSAGAGGSLGVDGDSTVIRVKVAQLTAMHELGPVRVEGAIGFVPDTWLRTLETDYPVKPLSRTGSEHLLGWPTSDLAIGAGASFGMVRAALTFGNGEGLSFPERNTGKTTTAVIEVVPVASPSLRVALSGVGRDGSLGVASIRDRRAGGGAVVTSPWARGGAELVRAWGIGDRGDATGVLVAGWAEVTVIPDLLFVAARGATLGYTNVTGRQSTYGGGIAVEPWARANLRAWLAIDRVTTSGAAMPLPGSDPGDATLVMLVASVRAPFTVE